MGINPGGNLGENVFYSGTVGAAAEATIHHVPAFAISVVHRAEDFDYTEAAQFARKMAELVPQFAVKFRRLRVTPERFGTVGIVDRRRRADEIRVGPLDQQRKPGCRRQLRVVLAQE